jgi:urea transport system permease protein
MRRVLCALAIVLPVLLLIGFQHGVVLAADEAPPAASASSAPAAPASPIEQALIDIAGDNAEARKAAAAFLIEKGDASLIPRLDDIRASGDRAVRVAIKPVVDLLKNRANLTSASPDFRRSAASDLASTGLPEAITLLHTFCSSRPVTMPCSWGRSKSWVNCGV